MLDTIVLFHVSEKLLSLTFNKQAYLTAAKPF